MSPLSHTRQSYMQFPDTKNTKFPDIFKDKELQSIREENAKYKSQIKEMQLRESKYMLKIRSLENQAEEVRFKMKST